MVGAEAEEGGAEADGMLVDSGFHEFEKLFQALFEGLGSGLPDDVVMVGVVADLMSLSKYLLEDLGLALGEFAEDEEGGGVAGVMEEFEGVGEVLEGGGVVVLWGAVVLAGVPVLKINGEYVQ